jgi:hypothetical protein
VNEFNFSGLAGGPNSLGTNLYTGPTQTLFGGQGGSVPGIPVTFSNLNLTLTPGHFYMAWLQYLSGAGTIAFGSAGSNPYPDGLPLGRNPNNGFWIGNPAGDFAFTAEFKAASVGTAAPTPVAGGAGAILLADLGVWRKLCGARSRQS